VRLNNSGVEDQKVKKQIKATFFTFCFLLPGNLYSFEAMDLHLQMNENLKKNNSAHKGLKRKLFQAVKHHDFIR